METTVKASHASRSTDRVLEALATLAALLDRTMNEVKGLDAGFQTRLTQAVHETEVTLKDQAAEQLKKALAEAVAGTRQEVADELSATFQQELQIVLEASKTEFDDEREKLTAALNEAQQKASQAEKEKAHLIDEVRKVEEDALNEIEKVQAMGGEHLKQAMLEADARARKEVTDHLTKNFQAELQQALEAARKQFETEKERLNKDLKQASESTARLETERVRMQAEVKHVKEQAQKEIEKARQSAEASKAKADASASAAVGIPPEVDAEVAKVEAKIGEISAVIEDPASELAMVIRKNVERSEMESFVKGIRFVVERIGK